MSADFMNKLCYHFHNKAYDNENSQKCFPALQSLFSYAHLYLRFEYKIAAITKSADATPANGMAKSFHGAS